MKTLFLSILFALNISNTQFYQVSKVVEITDGDTFEFEYIIFPGPKDGQGIFGRHSFRLAGYDAWELSGKRQTIEVTQAEEILGMEAKEFVLKQFAHAQSITIVPSGKLTYDRQLAYIFINGKSLGDMLFDNCLAIPYNGRTYGEVKKGCKNPRER